MSQTGSKEEPRKKKDGPEKQKPQVEGLGEIEIYRGICNERMWKWRRMKSATDYKNREEE